MEFDVVIGSGAMPLIVSYAMLKKWRCRIDVAETSVACKVNGLNWAQSSRAICL